MGHEVTGIDLSAGMLEKAKHDAENLGLEIDFFHGDVENLSFEDSSFDLVVSKFLLWTLPKPSCAISEWKRVLKPKGRIFAIDGDWFDPRPNRRIKRKISEWTGRLVKKNHNSLIFKNYYGSIRDFLPLYDKISPENGLFLFSQNGLVNTAANPLLEIQKLKKIGNPSRRDFLGLTLFF
jgi:ubiquinone/menaquinone biosynthesis C-methylase UbiE